MNFDYDVGFYTFNSQLIGVIKDFIACLFNA